MRAVGACRRRAESHLKIHSHRFYFFRKLALKKKCAKRRDKSLKQTACDARSTENLVCFRCHFTRDCERELIKSGLLIPLDVVMRRAPKHFSFNFRAKHSPIMHN